MLIWDDFLCWPAILSIHHIFPTMIHIKDVEDLFNKIKLEQEECKGCVCVCVQGVKLQTESL